jgi:hypothetical protein
LQAEATFRINIAIPFAMLVGTMLSDAVSKGAGSVVLAWGLALAIAARLLSQGVGRQVEAVSTIQRAVLQGTIKHPLNAAVEEIRAEQRATQSSRAAEDQELERERRAHEAAIEVQRKAAQFREHPFGDPEGAAK